MPSAPTGSETGGGSKPEKKENSLLSLLLNVVLPGLILNYLSNPDRLGPLNALFVAISLPIGYAIYDAYVRRKLNFFSVVGFISVLLTGILAFPKDPFWFALKEAVIPIVFASAIMVSHKWGKPLIRLFLWNPDILDTERVEAKLAKDGHTANFNKLLFQSSLLLSTGLLFSAVANFFISMYLLDGTDGGSEERMKAVGKQTWITYLVIGVPLMGIMLLALWRLFKGIEKLTGLTMEDLLHGQAKTVQVKRKTKPDDKA